uniref:hypothetical protein n=1 Tax=Methylobacterium sp. B34 TaxID=95563 RepID=UPI001FCC8777|nr:hypothetical protein [Methylobacterium sp. B34]
MTLDLHRPGRTTRLDRLVPGSVYLIAGRDGPDLALVVQREGRREALLLNRRHAVDGHLRVASEIAPEADVLALPGPSWRRAAPSRTSPSASPPLRPRSTSATAGRICADASRTAGSRPSMSGPVGLARSIPATCRGRAAGA